MKKKKSWGISILLGVLGLCLCMGTATLSMASAAQNTVDVYYYNGGFWNAMLTNNDFKNQFTTATYDEQTDTVNLVFDYRSASGDADAWGPANYIIDEYCDWSSANTIIIEIKNNSTNTVADFRMFFSGYTDTTKQTETHIATKGGGKYYLRSKDGNITEYTCGLYSSGGYNIPVNFDGELIIPVSEMEGFWSDSVVSFACIKRINFKFSKDWSVGDLTLGKVGYTEEVYTATNAPACNFVPMIQGETQADVYYYNGGFWNAMLTNNDFKNQFTTVEYDYKTDIVRLVFDYRSASMDATAWGPTNYIQDEYCDWSSAETLVMEIKNNSSTTIADFRMFFSGYMDMTKQTETHIATKGGGKYYLRNKNGTVTAGVCGSQSIGGYNIPANFDGELIIPVSEMSGYWGGAVSLNCIQRVNFHLSRGWAVGDLMLGKVGYSKDAYVPYSTEYSFVPTFMVTADSESNDMKYIKNWLYNNDVQWLNDTLGALGSGNSVVLSDVQDEMIIDYRNTTDGDGMLWCADFEKTDRDFSDYQYLVLNVKNNKETTATFGFLLTEGLTEPKEHYLFKYAYLRQTMQSMENSTRIVKLDGRNITLPSWFDGYIVLEISESNMKEWESNSTFDKTNAGALNLFITSHKEGSITFGKPMLAKSNKILDSTLAFENIVNNDTRTTLFNVTTESKIYDGEALVGSVSNYQATYTWYQIQSGYETRLNEAPTSAGQYKVKATATAPYNYEAEKMVSIKKADCFSLIKLVEKTYYAGDFANLELADDSIKGTITLNDLTALTEGNNKVKFTFVPENENYKTVIAIAEITAMKKSAPPMHNLTVSDKVEDGNAAIVTVTGITEYELKYYEYVNGEYQALESAPTKVGQYKVVVHIEGATEGESAIYKITQKQEENTPNVKDNGCKSSLSSIVFFPLSFVGVMLLRKKRD